MTKSDQFKILNSKIKANNAQYKTDRLNAEISAFSEGDLDKYEFLTRKDLKYKLNALNKAKFEFSPLGKAFNQGLDKEAENYKEEGVIKLLKDIKDKMVRPIGGNNDNRNNGENNDDNDDNDDDDNGDNDDNGDDVSDVSDISDGNNGSDGNDEIAETGSIDLSWMNDLQLYRQIASEVFARYNRDKDSLELFTLRNFKGNINNEHVKNKKDAREEFKTVKKNVKSEALKQIVKDLKQAIFGYDDNNDKKDDNNEKAKKKLDKLPKKHYTKTSDNLLNKLANEAKEFLKINKKNDELNAKAKDSKNIDDLLKEMVVDPNKDNTGNIDDLLKEMGVDPNKDEPNKDEPKKDVPKNDTKNIDDLLREMCVEPKKDTKNIDDLLKKMGVDLIKIVLKI